MRVALRSRRWKLASDTGNVPEIGLRRRSDHATPVPKRTARGKVPLNALQHSSSLARKWHWCVLYAVPLTTPGCDGHQRHGPGSESGSVPLTRVC